MMAGFHKNMNYYTGSPSNSKHKERRPKKSHLSLGLAGSLDRHKNVWELNHLKLFKL
jgi:hypothetical protein